MKKHSMKIVSLCTLLALVLSLDMRLPAVLANETESGIMPAGNLISDGEFEQELDGGYWRYHGGTNQESDETTVMISPDEGIDGGSCLKLMGGVNCGAKIYAYIPDYDISDENENTYTFSVYCKATKGGVQYFPYIKYFYYDGTGTYMGERNLVDNTTNVNVANQWVKVTKTLKIPAGGQAFELYLRTADTENTDENDYVLFDKVMVYRDNEYPTTEKNLFTLEYGYGFELRQDKGGEVPTGDTAVIPWQTDVDSDGNYVAHGGKTYLKIYNGAGGATTKYDFADSAVTNLQGQRFRLSFWLKSSTTDKGTANGVAAFKIFRKTSTGSTGGSNPLAGSSKINKVGDWYYMTPQKADTWEKFTIYFTFGGDGIKIPISACVPNGVPGHASVSIDDIVLTRVPDATMHGFGDLYDYYEQTEFSAGEIVSAQTYYVPETEGKTDTMISILYENVDGKLNMVDFSILPLTEAGFYEATFTIPATGKYVIKSGMWNVGTDTGLYLRDCIAVKQP